MRVATIWQGKRRFISTGPSGYSVAMDAKEEAGGEGKGNRPMELLLMGLTGCTGIDIAMILERMRQPLESMEIEAEGKRREEYPQAFTEIELTYRLTGNLQPAKVWRAIQLSEQKYCSAAASLKAKIIPRLILNGQEVPRPEDDGDLEA